MHDEDRFYIDLVGQIIDGFATFEWRGRSLFIKHHDFRQQAEIPRFFQKFKKEAVAQGIPTEEEAIKEAVSRGDWSDKDESFFKEQNQKIVALTKAAQHMKIPSQREQQMKIIQEYKDKLTKKKEEREAILEYTAEGVAYQKTHNRFMEGILFKDPEFLTPFVEGEDCSSQEFAEVRNMQTKVYNAYNDENISHAVLRDFFSSFMPFSESPMDFIGKPIVKMTVFQVKLISFSKLFFNILKNHTDIPEVIRKDPDAIIQYIEAQSMDERSQRNRPSRPAQKQPSDKGASTYFGANKEDIKKMAGKGEKVVSLHDQLKKHGGSMNMEQMMRMTGDID